MTYKWYWSSLFTYLHKWWITSYLWVHVLLLVCTSCRLIHMHVTYMCVSSNFLPTESIPSQINMYPHSMQVQVMNWIWTLQIVTLSLWLSSTNVDRPTSQQPVITHHQASNPCEKWWILCSEMYLLLSCLILNQLFLNNEIHLVTCTTSLTCARWLIILYAWFSLWLTPQPGTKYNIVFKLNFYLKYLCMHTLWMFTIDRDIFASKIFRS